VVHGVDTDGAWHCLMHCCVACCAGSLREFQSSMSYPTGWWRQFTALFGREFKSMTRNPFDVAARCVLHTDCWCICAAFMFVAVSACWAALQRGIVSSLLVTSFLLRTKLCAQACKGNLPHTA
jgi:hypothetical protein